MFSSLLKLCTFPTIDKLDLLKSSRKDRGEAFSFHDENSSKSSERDQNWFVGGALRSNGHFGVHYRTVRAPKLGLPELDYIKHSNDY